MDTLRVAVVGASGYTGAELLRLLLGHPRVSITLVCANKEVGKRVSQVHPALRGLLDVELAAFDCARVRGEADVAFCGMPHGASAGIVGELLDAGVPVLDLSADYRLHDATVYGSWYGQHPRPELLPRAVYGLPELHREALRTASLVAVPGCYPTSAILPLAPPLRAGLVDPTGIVVDSKSGVSGAGRAPAASTHFPETSEGIRAYKSGGAHRHIPEIEQELGVLAGVPITITFTPHLVPMTRGILTTAYAAARDGTSAEACVQAARDLYRGSPSVVVLDPGEHPDTLWARGSNRAFVAYFVDGRSRRVVAQCAIDNLGKGASGQAVQCLNVMRGWPEGTALEGAAL